MAHDTYSAERCDCGAPAATAMIDRRGFVHGAACTTHRVRGDVPAVSGSSFHESQASGALQ